MLAICIYIVDNLPEMRTTTEMRMASTIDAAKRTKSDFIIGIEIELPQTKSGLVVFGDTKDMDTELLNVKTDISVNWQNTFKNLKVTYAMGELVSGLLFSKVDENVLPEKKLISSKLINGFEVNSEDYGSSIMFGVVTEFQGRLEIFENVTVPAMEQRYATRLVKYHVDPLVSSALNDLL
jgi:hypothetical protein